MAIAKVTEPQSQPQARRPAERTELVRLLGLGKDASALNSAEMTIVDLALDAFDTPKIASEFLLHRHRLLNGQSPWAVALSRADGHEKVERILASIVYGLPA